MSGVWGIIFDCRYRCPGFGELFLIADTDVRSSGIIFDCRYRCLVIRNYFLIADTDVRGLGKSGIIFDCRYRCPGFGELF